MEPFADVDELQQRISWELSEGERRTALLALESLSLQARAIGSESWVGGPSAMPALKTLTIGACARFMTNPEAYTLSRSGDETVQWSDKHNTGRAQFDEEERAQIRALAGSTSFTTVGTFIYDNTPTGGCCCLASQGYGLDPYGAVPGHGPSCMGVDYVITTSGSFIPWGVA